MEKKITYAQALNTVLSNENIVLAFDVREKLEALLASVSKKSGEKKDTAQQVENAEMVAYAGIEEVYWSAYKNGFERLNAVLSQIASTSLNKSALVHITNLIGTLEKKGICHILVNNERIGSWVNTDG